MIFFTLKIYALEREIRGYPYGPQNDGELLQKEVIFDESANALYIDTGACVGNELSAAIIDNSQVKEVISQKTHLNDII